MMDTVMGVDVGGTKILIGLVRLDGTITHERRYPSQRGSQEIAIAAVKRAVAAYWAELVESGAIPRPDAIGLGLVGQVDHRRAEWVFSMATPILTPYPLGREISEQFQIPIIADNDVHCATLAEIRFGVGRRFRDFVYLNVGTGIAAGLVSDGRLIRGHQNNAGEVGHIVANIDVPCECGRVGCIEAYASGGGMIRHARALMEQYPDSVLAQLDREGRMVSSTIIQAAREGDALAIRVAELMMKAQLSMVQDIINFMDPQAIVCGGGVFRDPWLLQGIIDGLTGWLPPNNLALLDNITVSKLDPQKIGLIGAALCAYQETSA